MNPISLRAVEGNLLFFKLHIFKLFLIVSSQEKKW